MQFSPIRFPVPCCDRIILRVAPLSPEDVAWNENALI